MANKFSIVNRVLGIETRPIQPKTGANTLQLHHDVQTKLKLWSSDKCNQVNVSRCVANNLFLKSCPALQQGETPNRRGTTPNRRGTSFSCHWKLSPGVGPIHRGKVSKPDRVLRLCNWHDTEMTPSTTQWYRGHNPSSRSLLQPAIQLLLDSIGWRQGDGWQHLCTHVNLR